MSDHRFDSISIPISAAGNRELRVEVPEGSAANIDLAVFRDPHAPGAEASVRLTRDGALALIHALETALGETGALRVRALDTPGLRDWRVVQARAA